MASVVEIAKHYTEIQMNKIEHSIFQHNENHYQNNQLSQENEGQFLLYKCIALEDMNLDIELNNPKSRTEIDNYIYFYNNGIKRTFNKNSKKLLLNIPEFHLE